MPLLKLTKIHRIVEIIINNVCIPGYIHTCLISSIFTNEIIHGNINGK